MLGGFPIQTQDLLQIILYGFVLLPPGVGLVFWLKKNSGYGNDKILLTIELILIMLSNFFVVKAFLSSLI